MFIFLFKGSKNVSTLLFFFHIFVKYVILQVGQCKHEKNNGNIIKNTKHQCKLFRLLYLKIAIKQKCHQHLCLIL